MAAQTATLTVGSQVYRKSDFGNCRKFYGFIGTIEKFMYGSGKARAYVRWHGSMRLWSGTVDGHTTIAVSQLVLATSERAEQLVAIKAEMNRAYQEQSAARQAERLEQFRNAEVGMYWHIHCPNIRPGSVSAAYFQGFDTATGYHIFKCDSYRCQEEHLVSDANGTVVMETQHERTK